MVIVGAACYSAMTASLAVGEALRSERDFALAMNLSEFVVAIRERAALSRPPAPVAARMLAWRDKQLRKRARHLAGCSAAERHAVRIAAKKLRYAAESFASLFTARPRVVRQMVDRLGEGRLE